MRGSNTKNKRDEVNKNDYQWKLNSFQKRNYQRCERDKLKQDKLVIKEMKQSITAMMFQINIRDETIMNQSVTLENRAHLIDIQRKALRTSPQSVIEWMEHNAGLQATLDTWIVLMIV